MSHLRPTLTLLTGLGDIRGRVWLPPTATRPEPALAVIQGANDTSATHRTWGGRYVQIRAYVIPADPRTPRQLAARQRYTDGNAAWHAATPAERAALQPAARAQRISTYAAWMKQWCRDHPLPQPTTWDAGTTTWDGGTTTWD